MQLNLRTAPECEPVTLGEAKNFLKVDLDDDDALIASAIVSGRKFAEHETKRAIITQTWQLIFDTVGVEFEIPKPPLQDVVSIKTIGDTESYVDEDSADSQAVLKVAATAGFAAADTVVVGRGKAREEELVVLSVQDGVSLTMTGNLGFPHTAAQGDRVEVYSLVDKSAYRVGARDNTFSRVSLRPGHSWPAHRGFASFIVEFIAGHGDDSDAVPETMRKAMLLYIGSLYENRGGIGASKGQVASVVDPKLLLAPYKVWRL